MLSLRFLVWGLATGAATGAVLGVITIFGLGSGRRDTVAPSPVEALSGTVFGALLGAVFGILVSVIPSAVGALLVTGLIGHLHPHPSSTVGVQRSLQRIFAAYAALLNAALLLAVFIGGKGLASLTSGLPYILVGDVCVALMLWRASASISRAMVGRGLIGEQRLATATPRARAW